MGAEAARSVIARPAFRRLRQTLTRSISPFHKEITVDGREKSCIGGRNCACENVRARPGSSARTQSENERVSENLGEPS